MSGMWVMGRNGNTSKMAPQVRFCTCGAECDGGLTEIFLDDAHLLGS